MFLHHNRISNQKFGIQKLRKLTSTKGHILLGTKVLELGPICNNFIPKTKPMEKKQNKTEYISAKKQNQLFFRLPISWI